MPNGIDPVPFFVLFFVLLPGHTLPGLLRLERERMLERQRRARKKAEAAAQKKP